MRSPGLPPRISFLLLFSFMTTLVLTSSGEYFSPEPFPRGDCLKLEKDFMREYGDLSKCLVRNAPLTTFCLHCRENYLQVEEFISRLENSYQSGSNKTSCYEVMCMQNDIGIICREFQYAQYIWLDAKCDYCYQNNDVHSGELKEDVLKYMSFVKNVTSCFKNGKDVCRDCEDQYRDLKNFFFKEWYSRSLNGSYQCRDVYDKYNVTMKKWSDVYGCQRVAAEPYTASYALIVTYIVGVYFIFYLLVIYILPKYEKLNLQELKARTAISQLGIGITELRPEGSNLELLSSITDEDIKKQMNCPCFKHFIEFIQSYRDAKEDYKRDEPPEKRVLVAIHQKYYRQFHRKIMRDDPSIFFEPQRC